MFIKFCMSVVSTTFLAIGALSFTASAQTPVRSPTGGIKLKQDSKRALIALKVENPTIFHQDENGDFIASGRPRYHLIVTGIKPEKKKFKFNAQLMPLWNPDSGYVFVRVKAKPHALKSGGKSGALGCYHDGTLYFDVAPGSVNFLGTIDRNKFELKWLHMMKVQQPKKNQYFMIGDGITLPEITPPSAGDITALENFIQTERPKINGKVVPITTKPIVLKRSKAITGEFTCT